MNKTKQLSFEVDGLKVRLDKYLAETQSDISRSVIQKDIEAGQVKVNGKIINETKHVVRKGDEIVYNYESHEKEQLRGKNIPIKTLYNNHGLLIIDKPPGLVVHPGAGFKGDSLAEALLYKFKDIHLVGEEGRPGIVHRLDKDTSGVMLVALTQEMYEYLKDAFAERKIKKEYIALAHGRMDKTHGFIDTPIGKSKSDFRKYSTKNMIEAKPSLTEYQVSELLDDYTLFRVKLHTGRTHQIRVHLASLGHPLAGDTLYGKKDITLKDLHRQFLHASRIEVRLPDGTWIEAESPLPQDLKQVLTNLNSNYANR